MVVIDGVSNGVIAHAKTINLVCKFKMKTFNTIAALWLMLNIIVICLLLILSVYSFINGRSFLLNELGSTYPNIINYCFLSFIIIYFYLVWFSLVERHVRFKENIQKKNFWKATILLRPMSGILAYWLSFYFITSNSYIKTFAKIFFYVRKLMIFILFISFIVIFSPISKAEIAFFLFFSSISLLIVSHLALELMILLDANTKENKTWINVDFLECLRPKLLVSDFHEYINKYL